MISQKLMWTALPAGMEGDKLKLAVFLSPFLFCSSEEKCPGLAAPCLQMFKDFGDWPSTLQKMHFRVVFRDPNAPKGPPIRWFETKPASPKVAGPGFVPPIASPVPVPGPAIAPGGGASGPAVIVPPQPDSQLWTHHFRGDLAVACYTDASFEAHFKRYRGFRPRSYRAADVMAYLRALYIEAARQPEISRDWLLSVLPTLQPDRDEDPVLGFMAAGQNGQAEAQFREVADFHDWRNKPTGKGDYPTRVEDLSQPTPEFHQKIAALSTYPFLLRQLGLVIDIEIPDAARRGIPEDCLLSVEPHGAFNDDDHISLATRCSLDVQRSRFHARDADSRRKQFARDGALLLLKGGAQAYDVVQGDLDGAAIKIVHLIDHMRLLDPKRPEGKNIQLPALRSGGISLVRRDSEDLLSDLTEGLDSPPDPDNDTVLRLADITAGFRADVWDDKSKVWRSLCGRQGTYVFTNPTDPKKALTLSPPPDEGMISEVVASSATPEHGDFKPFMYLHPALFDWQGWGLSVPQPGKMVAPDGAVVDNAAGGDTPDLKVTFSPVKDSLPRLRFGRIYRIRVRLVDLAGYSVPANKANLPEDPFVRGEIRYLRFEPVSDPIVVVPPEKPLKPALGESLERVVLRSNFDQEVAEYTQATGYAYDEIVERYVAPPQSSKEMVERHGQLDTPKVVDKGAYTTLVDRQGSYPDTAPNVHEATPYLPDPLALGTLLQLRELDTDLPSAETIVPFLPAGTRWPDFLPLRLQLAERPDDQADRLSWDAAARTLTVFLEKAGIYTVRFSSSFLANEGDTLPVEDNPLDKLGLWDWMVRADRDPGAHSKIADPVKAARGHMTMLTPFRELTVVHAVQQPLQAPKFRTGTVSANKTGLGRTYALVSGTIDGHWKSTVSVDVEGMWTDIVDDLSQDKPHELSQSLHITQEKDISYTEREIGIANVRHEFRDTKYHRVNYRITGTTRFQEHFEKGPFTRSSDNFIDVLNSERPGPLEVLYAVPAFGWSTVSKHGIVTSTRKGGILRVYLARPWYTSGNGELLGVVLARQPEKDIDEKHRAYISQWGKDPVWRSADLTPLDASSARFPRASQLKTNLFVPEAGLTVHVAGHEVHYDEARRLWYSDIEISGIDNYFPFVRLALARFQPNSLPKAHLSAIVMTDFVQLPPDREAKIFSGKVNGVKGVIVEVKGPAPRQSEAFPADLGELPNTVELSFERGGRLDKPATESDLDWISIPGEFQLTGSIDLSGKARWSGKIPIPDEGQHRIRIVLKEYERFNFSNDMDRRLVYAYALVLPAT